MTGTILSTLAFLGKDAIPEALRALQRAHATHPSAASDIIRRINQNHLQESAQAMESLAPRCASNVSSALKTAAKHLRY